jgi:hypothetical protein
LAVWSSNCFVALRMRDILGTAKVMRFPVTACRTMIAWKSR